jgi:hypothetical protein
MTLSKAILRALIVFVAIFLIEMIVGMLIPMKTAPSPNILLWLLVNNAVVVTALCIVAVRTEWRGWKLGAAVASIPVVIASANLIEAVIFLKNSPMDFGRIFVYTVISAALIVPVWMLLFGKRNDVAPEHYHPIQAKSFGERAWKFVVSDFTYLFLYLGTGMIIFPYVKDFWATQPLPTLGTIIPLQLLVRGPVFVLLCVALTRMLGMPRLTGALTVGLVFTLLSGVAPLLMPNPVFPDAVRWVHFCEVTSENFVFGVIVAWLWGQPTLVRTMALRHAA